MMVQIIFEIVEARNFMVGCHGITLDHDEKSWSGRGSSTSFVRFQVEQRVRRNQGGTMKGSASNVHRSHVHKYLRDPARGLRGRFEARSLPGVKDYRFIDYHSSNLRLGVKYSNGNGSPDNSL